MKTIRAKELQNGDQLITEHSEWSVNKADITRRGNIMLWLGKDGDKVIFLRPMDVVVIQ